MDNGSALPPLPAWPEIGVKAVADGVAALEAGASIPVLDTNPDSMSMRLVILETQIGHCADAIQRLDDVLLGISRIVEVLAKPHFSPVIKPKPPELLIP